MKELENKTWDYILYEDGDRLILSVVVGGVAMYEVNVVLNAAESGAYRQKGMEGLKSLLADIQLHPQQFKERHVKI